VRDYLVQREQGSSQPQQLPVRSLPAWLPLVVVAVVVLGALVAWLAASTRAPQPSPTARQPVVLLSGRDDHGLLADPFVTLVGAPNGQAAVGRIRDGSFVRVLEQHGDWMRVQQIAVPQAEGWVNDYYLRDRALRADGQGQVTFADAQLIDGQVSVAVRAVERPDESPVWVAASLLREVGAQRPQNPLLQR
jgi:hypothetical protein